VNLTIREGSLKQWIMMYIDESIACKFLLQLNKNDSQATEAISEAVLHIGCIAVLRENMFQIFSANIKNCGIYFYIINLDLRK
jgi:hypothetical protein